jgi:hypothetical protein
VYAAAAGLALVGLALAVLAIPAGRRASGRPGPALRRPAEPGAPVR